VKNAQNQYGVNRGTHQHYHQYCTRKLYRLRRSLRLTNGGKKYQKREINPEMVSTERHLMIPLYQAERAWAYAMELKESAAPTGLEPRVRFHVLRKLAKAIVWANQLSALAAGKVDQKSSIEVEAYIAWTEANYLIEKENWEPAIEKLVKARTIYVEISELGDPEEQELFQERVNQIDTSLRVSQFNFQGGNINDIKTLVEMTQQAEGYDLLNTKLESALQEARKRQASGMEKISWRGRVVPIKSEKLRIALINAEEIRGEVKSQAKSEEEQMQAYTNLFMAYGDTIELIRNELKTLEAQTKNEKQKSSKAETEESNLQFMRNYVTYLKLTKTIERDQMLCESYKKKNAKPEAFVRTYDALMQNYAELQELTESDAVEQMKQVVSNKLTCQAFKCYYVALVFINSGEWEKALALLDRCRSRVEDAISHHEECSKRNEVDIASLNDLRNRIEGERSLATAKAFIASQNLSQSSDSSTGQFLGDGMGQYSYGFVSNQNLANFPPDFSAVACKPILFDLAHMELEFPNLESRKQKKSFWKLW